jgi:hypothetical protein
MRTFNTALVRSVCIAIIVLMAAAGCPRQGQSTEIRVTVRANACYQAALNNCYMIRVPLADIDVQGPDGFHFTSTTDETGEIVVEVPRAGSYAVRIDTSLIAERLLSATVQVRTAQSVELSLQGKVTIATP